MIAARPALSIVSTSTALPARVAAFVAELAKGGSATAAAIRAGYSERTARAQASRLRARLDVQAALKEAGDANAEPRRALGDGPPPAPRPAATTAFNMAKEPRPMKFRSPTEAPIFLALVSGHTMSVGCEPTEVPPQFLIVAIERGCEPVDIEPASLPREARLALVARQAEDEQQQTAAMNAQVQQARRDQRQAEVQAMRDTGRPVAPWRKKVA